MRKEVRRRRNKKTPPAESAGGVLVLHLLCMEGVYSFFERGLCEGGIDRLRSTFADGQSRCPMAPEFHSQKKNERPLDASSFTRRWWAGVV